MKYHIVYKKKEDQEWAEKHFGASKIYVASPLPEPMIIPGRIIGVFFVDMESTFDSFGLEMVKFVWGNRSEKLSIPAETVEAVFDERGEQVWPHKPDGNMLPPKNTDYYGPLS